MKGLTDREKMHCLRDAAKYLTCVRHHQSNWKERRLFRLCNRVPMHSKYDPPR